MLLARSSCSSLACLPPLRVAHIGCLCAPGYLWLLDLSQAFHTASTFFTLEPGFNISLAPLE
jgi:hypothetical protein